MLTKLWCLCSYISRSVAGSYDNEGIAIFALVLTFYLYVKTLNTGSLAWGTLNALAYLYMVSSFFVGHTVVIHVVKSLSTSRIELKQTALSWKTWNT